MIVSWRRQVIPSLLRRSGS